MKIKIAAAVAAFTALFLMAGCTEKEPGGETDGDKEPSGIITETDTYTRIEKPIKNEERGWKLNGVEVIPADYEEGDKLPTVILVHGGTATEQSMLPIAYKLAENGVAAYTFGCHGALPGTDLYSSHYTSRMSDLEAAISYVRSREYTDTENMYLLGESYGGIVVSYDIVRHPDMFKGLILVSTGITDDMVGGEGDKNGFLEKYEPDVPWRDYIKQYDGDVIGIVGDDDQTGALGNMQVQMAVYKEREGGARADMYVVEGGHGFSAFATEEIRDEAIGYMLGMITPGAAS